ncbi:MAG TPA: peroxiredoxin-like family protein [Candidatus Angelobacter sp.]
MFCREHVAQLRVNEPAIHQKGAKLVAVGLGDASYARHFREETGISFPLLIDDKRQAYRAIGLRNANLLHMLRRDNARARQRAKASGVRQHRLGKDPLQLGGSFVFAPGNVDKFVHVSETFGDTAPVEQVMAAIR